MYYSVSSGHGLPFNPFKAIIAPRPIGWISSVGADGTINLAPYSFFNAVGANPPIVMFSSDGRKDSLNNIEETGEFACNFVGEDLMFQMSETSASVARDVNEFEIAGLKMADCEQINVPRVREAHSALECKLTQIVRQKNLEGANTDSWTVFGQVVGIHIDEAVLTDGRFDLTKAKPVVRLGYRDYAVVREVFELKRPDEN